MPDQDFLAHLDEQLDFMRSSARGFDEGNEPEAKRLAVQLRVLLHDAQGARPNRSVSLLTRLGVRDILPWRDTAIAPDLTWEFDFSLGLCRLRGEGKGDQLRMRHVAPLDDLGPDRNHPPAAFVDWWHEPVLADRVGHTFSRENFVRMVADQDGGAHVDADLDASYRALTRENSMQVYSGIGMLAFGFGPANPGLNKVAGPPLSSVALTSIRQIAHEALSTLESDLVRSAECVTAASPICSLSISEPVAAGRNDSCPCGSGRKFKQCFGRRAPRRPRLTMTGAIAMK